MGGDSAEMKRQLSRVCVKLCLVQESQQNRGAEKKQEVGVSGVDPLFSFSTRCQRPTKMGNEMANGSPLRIQSSEL